ncbi:MAG TPA: Tat pathway signal protein [Terriglobales bacterium]|nr:Tat pathway signal protein [Terriglobales bacterium]
MHRRKFLRDMAAAAGWKALSVTASGSPPPDSPAATAPRRSAPRTRPGPSPDIAGHTLLCEFREPDGAGWRVYEDLRRRDGAITFVADHGDSVVLAKTAEPAFATAAAPYLGLSLREIGMSPRDLLAERLLAGGEPDPEQVREAAPPLGSPPPAPSRFSRRPPWTTFVGNKAAYDTQPVFPGGDTRTYHPSQFVPEIAGRVERRWEGILGEGLPAARKVMPIEPAARPAGAAPPSDDNPPEYFEVIVFADPRLRGEFQDKFIVQTWHRTCEVRQGRMARVVYGHTYPPFPPRRAAPAPEEFYRALLRFAQDWRRELGDMCEAALPDPAWAAMARHAFAKELMVRPGGVYPKYGAVDRDYAGSEYDGFQDIFTMSVGANLEWGRFEMARAVIDQYFGDYTAADGLIDMRGPETGQYGLTLSLVARYLAYTGDGALLLRHREKIEACAGLLAQLHDEGLRLPASDPGHGLIHGWSESDSCLAPRPQVWWLPYFGNSAMAVRGWRDLAQAWRALGHARPGVGLARPAAEWQRRADRLQSRLIAAVRAGIRRDLTPPFVPPYAGARLTVWESLARERPSPQRWAHRPYCELLQPGVLPDDLANAVIDCMRAYGGTTLGVVANMERPHPTGRDILGFISYGYALALLRLDRIDEFLLFLYSHRYHDHTPGSWTAGEVAGLTGGMPLFCIPAQQTIPLLVRWMLALEHPDRDRLELAKGVPRRWLASGREIRLDDAPTRWGRVRLRMAGELARGRAVAEVVCEGRAAPAELAVKFRLPPGREVRAVRANGDAVPLIGRSRDTALVATGGRRRFELIADCR